MLAVSNFNHWLKIGGIESALILLGAILMGRFAHWVSNRYVARVNAQVNAVLESGGVLSERYKRVRAVAQALEWTFVAVLSLVTAVLIFQRLDFPLNTLVAPATVVAAGVGFGSQQVVGDILAGFFLFSEHQFGVGDLVRLSVPGSLTGVSGTVEEITLRVTKLRTLQGEVIFLPNGALRQVTNLSREWSRVVVDIPVPIDGDLEKASSILRQVLDDIVKDDDWKSDLLGQPVVAGVESIGVDNVQFRLIARTLPGKQFDLARELRLRAALALQAAGLNAVTTGTLTSDQL
jgi:small-conductance mechanosensitive channel